MSSLPFLFASIFIYFCFFRLPIPTLKKIFSRFRVPVGCDLVAAAALPVTFGTSHMALIHRAQLTAAQVPPSQLHIASFLNCSNKAFGLCFGIIHIYIYTYEYFIFFTIKSNGENHFP